MPPAATCDVTVTEANNFMDTALGSRLQPLVVGSQLLYPFARIDNFNISVLKTGITNRKLKANITNGALWGWESGIRRLGDCTPSRRDAHTVIACTLDLSGINATFIAETRGDTLSNTQKTIHVNVTVIDTVGQLEATTGTRGEGVLHTLMVQQIHLKVDYDSELHLNEERERQFKGFFKQPVVNKMFEVLYGPYKDVLGRAITLTPFPRG